MLRVASIVEDTCAEGPGRRFALWVQGCSLRCAGCCNPEMFDARRGEPMAIDAIAARIPATVEGITLLGGEPVEQAAGCAALARAAKARGLTVMVFTGYTRAELDGLAGAAALLAEVDLLVDGRYDRARPEPPPPVGRRWIGSANQVMHHLTAAYAIDDPRLREPNTIEIRWSPGALSINGWPSADQLVRRAARRP
jgi:anaerobic ribonucleoside-triphosphate reductase activating protein